MNHFNKVKISLIILSFSLGLLSATSIVNAVKAGGVILALSSILACCKN